MSQLSLCQFDSWIISTLFSLCLLPSSPYNQILSLSLSPQAPSTQTHLSHSTRTANALLLLSIFLHMWRDPSPVQVLWPTPPSFFHQCVSDRPQMLAYASCFSLRRTHSFEACLRDPTAKPESQSSLIRYVVQKEKKKERRGKNDPETSPLSKYALQNWLSCFWLFFENTTPTFQRLCQIARCAAPTQCCCCSLYSKVWAPQQAGQSVTLTG